MNKDQRLALADAIIELINSRPASPRREELEMLIHAHAICEDAAKYGRAFSVLELAELLAGAGVPGTMEVGVINENCPCGKWHGSGPKVEPYPARERIPDAWLDPALFPGVVIAETTEQKERRIWEAFQKFKWPMVKADDLPEAVTISIDELKRLDIKPDTPVEFSAKTGARRLLGLGEPDPETGFYFTKSLKQEPHICPNLPRGQCHAFRKEEPNSNKCMNCSKTFSDAVAQATLSYDANRDLALPTPLRVPDSRDCNLSAHDGFCYTHGTSLCNASKPLTGWERKPFGCDFDVRLFVQSLDYGRKAVVWALVDQVGFAALELGEYEGQMATQLRLRAHKPHMLNPTPEMEALVASCLEQLRNRLMPNVG